MNDLHLETRPSLWQRIVAVLKPVARALGESPSERMWDRVDRLEREVARLKADRRKSD